MRVKGACTTRLALQTITLIMASKIKIFSINLETEVSREVEGEVTKTSIPKICSQYFKIFLEEWVGTLGEGEANRIPMLKILPKIS